MERVAIFETFRCIILINIENTHKMKNQTKQVGADLLVRLFVIIVIILINFQVDSNQLY